LLQEVGQTYGQLSTDVQSTVSNNTSATVARVSSGNEELELNLKDVLQKYGEKIGEDINSFQAKTSESIDIWRSAYKGELDTHAKSVKLTVEGCQQGLVQNLESAKTSMSDVLKTYSSSVKSATDALGSNLDGMTESIKKDLSLKLTAPKDELQKSCDVAAKNCVALASALESLSKKNIPLASKTIDDFTKEFGDKVSKMKVTLIEDAKSFVGEMKETLVGTLAAAEESPQSRGSTTAGTRAKSPLVKETAKKIDEAGRGYIDAVKKGIDALEKSTSERVTSVLRFEDELAKRWESIATTMGKVTELAEKIRLVPSEIGKPVDELLGQYVGKVNESLSSTRRLLNAHLLSLGDQASGTIKKWSSTLDKTKKEIGDLLIKKQEEELGTLVSRQIDVLQKIAADRSKELMDLTASKVETLKSQTLTTQSTISKHIAPNTELVRGSLEDIENKLKNALEASAQEFTQKTESKCRENEDSSARINDETAKAVTDLKEQFNSVINGEKEKIKQICGNADSKIKETTSENVRELNGIVSSLTGSFTIIIDTASEGYKKECESTKAIVITLLSEHLKNYTEAVTKITGEINSTFSKHFDDCNELTTSFQKKLDELLTAHQNGYETSSNRMLSGLINCIDQDEKAISQDARKMLKEFTDNTTKIAKESNSVETLLKTAWAEITDTQQINADKTWHYVTKRAILNHIKDMVGRSKSTVTIVVPNLHEAPISEVKRISKAIRINIVAGVDATLHKNLVTELLNQGNVRIWNFPERNYVSCTRDAEEVLIAPIAPKDIDCIATVSVEEGFIKLIMKIVGPMWLASAREVRSVASI
jgi:predicted hydrocarbon binding protein